ncbi:MAG: GTPase Era [Proteobacteria bacterium]|nr:MAG: GTPase Era [Pseudomonadota bacterium]
MCDSRAERSHARRRFQPAQCGAECRAPGLRSGRRSVTALHHRAGHVALVGRPNVGKSTLLNKLVGQKLSITSPRPQTTRHRVAGILTQAHAQFVFLDTPGWQKRHPGRLNRALNRVVAEALDGADVVVLVAEALRFGAEDRAVLAQLPDNRPAVLAINKVDALADKARLLPFIAEVSGLREFAEVVPVSARSGRGIDELLRALGGLLPESPLLYPEDELTDRSERFLAGEFLREKLFRLLGEEVPYATAVEIETFETAGELRRIGASILVDKPGQKAMIIGKGGQKLKEIATQARQDMERLFGGKVYLEVWVRVRRGWSEDVLTLRRLGYE